MYVINNRVTGENKSFRTFDELREFYKHLSIAEMSQWTGWRWVD